MIEPAIFATRDEIHRLPQTVPLFAMNLEMSSAWHKSVGLFKQNGTSDCLFVVWKHSGGISYSISNNGSVDREVFMDFLFEYYPDYATWFLFHPEWTL